MKAGIPFKEMMVLAVTLLFIFVFGEMLIRFYTSKHIVYDVEMSRYSMSMKKDSQNPLIEHVHEPNTKAKIMGVQMEINSDGLRDYEHKPGKSDKYRIAFLGDSLTLGWGVEFNDTFKAILEKELNKKYPAEIINFGTGNYNTEQEVNFFIENGLKYKPDKVVVFYFINDAEKTPVKSKYWYLGYSTLITFYWSKINSAISNLNPKKSFKEYYSDLYKDDNPGFLNARKAFLQLKKICEKNNIELQVVILPELHMINDYPFKREHALVKNFLAANKIGCLDLQPYFKNIENPIDLWVSYDDAHPNKTGHKLIAEYSLDFISKRKGK